MSSAQATYAAELIDAGLLIPTGVPGVFGRSGRFEDVLQRFDDFVARSGAPENPTVMRFPSILPRAYFERSGYLKSFPHLVGAVSSYMGDEHGHAELRVIGMVIS